MRNLKKLKIGVFDSGVGGITVFSELISSFDFGEFYYLGDNGNTPYGNKSNIELLSLAVSGVNKLVSCGVNVVVIGCNTLSLCVFNHLQRIFKNVKFFGVFPPIESFLFNGQDYVVFATKSTVDSLKIFYPKVSAICLPNLAADIENNAFNFSAVDIFKHISITDLRHKNIILGCTHYCFIKDKFISAFANANLISGNSFTVQAVKNYVKKVGFDHRCKNKKVTFLGDCADKNSCVFGKFYSKFEKI